jgi:uncharacterized protein
LSKASSLMFRITKACTSHPWFVVVFTLLLTGTAGYFTQFIERDHSMNRMVPPTEPIRIFYEEFRRHFNIESNIIIAVHDPDGIYSPETLQQIDRLSEKIAALDSINSVQSLSKVENILSDDGMITVEPLAETPPQTQEEALAFAEAARGNPMIKNGIVSEDETSTVLFARPAFAIDETHKAVVCAKAIYEITDNDPGPGKIYVTGLPVVFGLSNQMMDRDNKIMLPLVAALLVLLLWFSFRTVRGIWIPLAVVVVAVIWTYGFIGLVGMKTTIICASIPIVLVSMGIADGIHVLHEYYHHLRKGLANLPAIHLTMKEMNSPVVMTSLTTSVGFMALATSKIGPIREYGFAVALGIIWAMIFSLTFIPAALTILGKPKRLSSERTSRPGLLQRFSKGLGRYSQQHAKKIVATFAVILILTGVLSAFLKVRNNPVTYFVAGSDLRVSDEFLNEHFAGTGEISVQIDGLKPDALKDPELLSAIEKFRKSIEELPVVGRASSVNAFLKRMNVVLNNDDPAFNRIPGTREDMGDEWTPEKGRAKVAQYFLLYETTGGEELSRAVDFTYQRAHIHIQVKSNDSNDYRAIMDRINVASTELFDKDRTKLSFTGAGAINLKVVDYLVRGQIVSLILSFIGVFLMLVVLFRSLADAVIGAIPLIITVTTNFAVMVLTGIPLNMGTALIASVIIGVGVDYSIHFIHRYRLESQRTGDIGTTVEITMDTSGRAIIFNALSVGGGFAILLASSFMPLVYLGLLLPLVMVVNALAALCVIPAFLNLLAKRNGKVLAE